jgi:hypothetical protein
MNHEATPVLLYLRVQPTKGNIAIIGRGEVNSSCEKGEEIEVCHVQFPWSVGLISMEIGHDILCVCEVSCRFPCPFILGVALPMHEVL